MSTWVDRGPEGIIYRAAYKREVPRIDLLSFLFEYDRCDAQEDTVLHVDAEDPSKCINKAELRDLLKRTAHTLRHRFDIGKHGPGKDIVLVLSTGHWMLPNLFYATVGAGGIFSASSPATTARELAGQYQRIGATLLVCNGDTQRVAVAAAKILGLPASRLLLLGDGPAFSLHEAASNEAVPLSGPAELLEWERISDLTTLEDRTACVLFSSGTTGLPKGVCLSHRNLVASATLVVDPAKEYHARNATGFKFRTIAHLPAAHIAGIQGYLVNPTYWGGPVYWMRRFDFAKFLEYNKKYAITNIFSVPPIFLLIARSPLVTNQFDSLEAALSGAAPMSKDLQAAAQKKLGRGTCVLSQTWGLSETTGSMTTLPRGLTDDTGSVSMLVASGEARIVDGHGRDVRPGERGEILVRGPNVTKGYWKNPEANRQSFIDGWFCTGDIGYFKRGMLYVVDRKKELIKYKGNQVAPAELEGLLLTHPKIRDAAVIGVEGKVTEVPRAYVVADQEQISAKEIVSWVQKQVANHKQLRGGVIFIDAIPKSPAGKILRKDLRERAKKEGRPRL